MESWVFKHFFNQNLNIFFGLYFNNCYYHYNNDFYSFCYYFYIDNLKFSIIIKK